ncbi:MAG: hypothetical protein FJ126_13350 [Deltaproteobacteria bacterium]|nr:hypothetical protein [Deltaproteobacteria bacterium]
MQVPSGSTEDIIFRPCARAFFVYYVALAIFFIGPLINPAVGLPIWLGFIMGALVVAAVAYMRGQAYHISSQGLSKTWRWPVRRQDLPWANLGEVQVRRGLTQTLLRVGNLYIIDQVRGDNMFWFGLADPKAVKELIEGRRP